MPTTRKRSAPTPRPSRPQTQQAAPPAGAPPIADTATAVALKLWLTMAKAYQAAAELSRIDIAKHELTPAEFSIVEALYHKGPLLLGDVQRKVLVSSGGTTFLVDRLEKRGLVERQSCPSDRRARYAALTREGTAMMKRIFPAHAEAMREAMAGLTQTEQRAATALLKRLGMAAAAHAATHPACKEGIGGD